MVSNGIRFIRSFVEIGPLVLKLKEIGEVNRVDLTSLEFLLQEMVVC